LYLSLYLTKLQVYKLQVYKLQVYKLQVYNLQVYKLQVTSLQVTSLQVDFESCFTMPEQRVDRVKNNSEKEFYFCPHLSLCHRKH